MTGSVDTKRALEIVTAGEYLLVDDPCLFTLSDYYRHFFTCSCVNYEKTIELPCKSLRGEDRVHRACLVSILLSVGELLLVIVTPAVDLSILHDCE